MVDNYSKERGVKTRQEVMEPAIDCVNGVPNSELAQNIKTVLSSWILVVKQKMFLPVMELLH